MPALITSRFAEDPIKNKGAIHIFSIIHVWENFQLLRSGQNSNSFEILGLSWLPVSLMKIRSKMETLPCPKHFLHYKFVWDFMPVLLTCKIEEDPI